MVTHEPLDLLARLEELFDEPDDDREDGVEVATLDLVCLAKMLRNN
jgi:hypothetical protein